MIYQLSVLQSTSLQPVGRPTTKERPAAPSPANDRAGLASFRLPDHKAR